MAKIAKSILIQAPVERVFSMVVSEWQGSMAFFEGVYDWRPTTEGPMGDGSRFFYKAKVLVESQ